MPRLSFAITGASAPPAATPVVALDLRVTSSPVEEPVRALLLRALVQIDPARRPGYSAAQAARLEDVFGEPARWRRTLRGLLLADVSCTVPAFQGETTVALHVPCPLDWNAAGARYLDAIEDGVIPVLVLLSGTVYHEDAAGAARLVPLGRDHEARFDLPVAVWRELVARHRGETVYVPLRRDVFERLQRARSRAAAPTWERALEELLARAGEPAP